MSSHDKKSTTEGDLGGDDVTLAAGSDVVSQIRAHAAKVRSGEVTDDEGLHIWTAETEPEPPEPEVVDVREPGKLLPDDKTVPLESTRAELAQVIAEAKAAADVSDEHTEPPVTVPITIALDSGPVIAEPVVDLRRAPDASPPPGGGSLIDGQAMPQVSTSFWETDQPFRASGIDAPSRLRGGRRIPLMAWIVLVLVVIVVISVGIAVAVASTGQVT